MNIRTLRIRADNKNSYYNNSIKRESQNYSLYIPTIITRIDRHSKIQYPLTQRIQCPHLSNDIKLGSEYDFLEQSSTVQVETVNVQIVGFENLLNEIVTIDQTLENHILFTSHIHENSELFSIIYSYEEYDFDSTRLFEELKLEFNWSEIENLNLFVEDDLNGQTIDVLRCNSDNPSSERLNNNVECSVAFFCENPKDEIDDTLNEAHRSIDFDKVERINEIVDPLLILSPDDYMMIAVQNRFAFTSISDYDNSRSIDYVGCKRNLDQHLCFL